MFKSKILLSVTALSGALILSACGDDITRTNITNAGITINGTANEATSSSTTQPVASRPVFLHILDENGKSIGVLDGAFTDENGLYSLRLLSGTPGTRYAIEVQATTGVIYSFVTSTSVNVNPTTDGVFSVVSDIVGPFGGRSVDDYTSTEIDSIQTAAKSALTAATTDLRDNVAIKAEILATVGSQIIASSEAEITLITKANPVATDPADVDVVGPATNDLNDGGDVAELWDMNSSGGMENGTNDSFDTFFILTVGVTKFPAQAATVIQDDREVVYGPALNIGATGLNVTRKIYVDNTPAAVSFARFLEILDNPTGADIVVDIGIGGELGSDESIDNITASSNGNTTVEAGDFWLTNHQDLGDPAVGFFFPGASDAVKSDDVIDYFWNGLTVPAGGRITIIHWGFQNTGDDAFASETTAMVSGLTAAIPDSYFAGLSQQEVSDSVIAYFGLLLVTPDGSVTPGATVTLTNVTTTQTFDVTASPSGSFGTVGLVINSGDTVQVTATDGTDITLTAP